MSKLYERLLLYGNSNVSPLHMPGHKRKRDLCPIENPFAIDITEIDGFDNLHHPTGILKEAMEQAARIYGAEKSYFLVNGSSGGLLAAISACVPRNGTILVARNCHKSVYHGMILRELTPVYLCPGTISGWGISGEVTPEMVETAIVSHPEAKAVLLTSPTYEGICSNLRRICEIVHERGLPLIVDAAHGAHFSFWNLCESALSSGADLVVESLHKTLPSLTQTAILHKNSSRINEKCLEWYLQAYQTSSPSYVFMASMDSCISYMAGEQGQKDMQVYLSNLEKFRRKVAEFSGIRLLSGQEAGGVSYDSSKLVVQAEGWTGPELYETLRLKYGIQPEMCAKQYIILMTSLADNDEVFHKLFDVFADIHRKCGKSCGKLKKNVDICGFPSEGGFCKGNLLPEPQVVFPPFRAMEGKKKPCPLEACEGKVSGEFAYLYPPGVPLLAPGERITAQVLEVLKDNERQGLEVLGPENFQDGELLILQEEEE
ncbi:MAG: aminotransferase class I/II-fold pyridoxal phosphate-dependent enzyme [Lachnospiraceae bacterium]|nr:aminotransferase class I/II-fold pyridoxal phosphate-dependent enzyme [Lachnospiraceae bacterium]